MKIVINPLDKASIDEAVRMVREYQKDFARKEKEFTRRLAEIGVRVASSGFATADYDGRNDVTVALEKTPDGYAVVARGETVGFIEFGTGIRNREWDNTGMEYTPPRHGTYGKGHGKQPYGWWFYPNQGSSAVHTYGNPPAEAMRLARDEMVEKAIQIAREVWR